MTDFWQFVAIGLITGSLYALIALGYTMVYGIIELINFAHGDLFMLGSFFALQMALWIGAAALPGATGFEAPGTGGAALAIAIMLVSATVFCAGVNVGIDRWIYKPVRRAPKLAAIVTAIGVSFVLMQVGVVWFGSVDLDFPNLVGSRDLLAGTGSPVRLSYKDLMVIGITVPAMIALTVLVKFTTLGKAMRAAAQDPTAALLMGINVDRVIAATFAIGGALAGVASVVYGLYFNTVGYAMGFQNGVYAFTAAVLGGIGNIPGAVLGGILIGLIRSLGSAYVGEVWSEALIFVILIVILIFRPTGLLGSRTREKV
jgi:branched-chain amino acid transport system permease protein